jgi:ABC-type maltose transport system permease subunit
VRKRCMSVCLRIVSGYVFYPLTLTISGNQTSQTCSWVTSSISFWSHYAHITAPLITCKQLFKNIQCSMFSRSRTSLSGTRAMLISGCSLTRVSVWRRGAKLSLYIIANTSVLVSWDNRGAFIPRPILFLIEKFVLVGKLYKLATHSGLQAE